jgi:hypothetical protein
MENIKRDYFVLNISVVNSKDTTHARNKNKDYPMFRQLKLNSSMRYNECRR